MKDGSNNETPEAKQYRVCSARCVLLGVLSLSTLAFSSVAFTGWRYQGQVGGITLARAKAGALISAVSLGLAICVEVSRDDIAPSRN